MKTQCTLSTSFSLLGLVWLLLSCDNQEQCKTPATVVKLPGECYVFELSNGKQLMAIDCRQCCSGPIDDRMYSFQYIEGKKVLIGFEHDTDRAGCGGAKAVWITCIEELKVGEY